MNKQPWQYKSVCTPAEAIFKEKGSKFCAYITPLASKEEVHVILANLKENHPNARHFCYAYRIGVSEYKTRAYDDGEPNNSAGAPILGQIQSAELTNVMVVVVRYFGGTKLGLPGLVSAYKTAAKLAIERSAILLMEQMEIWQISCSNSSLDHIMSSIRKLHIPKPKIIMNAESSHFDLNVPLSKSELLSSALKTDHTILIDKKEIH
jgi:uncharacterized YigZ family protein